MLKQKTLQFSENYAVSEEKLFFGFCENIYKTFLILYTDFNI